MAAVTDMTVVEITQGERRVVHGPHRRDEAQRIADGARATGAQALVHPLTGDDLGEIFPFARGQWPPHGYHHGETGSIYVTPSERFVVSLIAGYAATPGVASPEQAAHATLELTRDDAAGGTRWFVYDRETGHMHCFEQSSFENSDTKPDQLALAVRKAGKPMPFRVDVSRLRELLAAEHGGRDDGVNFHGHEEGPAGALASFLVDCVDHDVIVAPAGWEMQVYRVDDDAIVVAVRPEVGGMSGPLRQVATYAIETKHLVGDGAGFDEAAAVVRAAVDHANRLLSQPGTVAAFAALPTPVGDSRQQLVAALRDVQHDQDALAERERVIREALALDSARNVCLDLAQLTYWAERDTKGLHVTITAAVDLHGQAALEETLDALREDDELLGELEAHAEPLVGRDGQSIVVPRPRL